MPDLEIFSNLKSRLTTLLLRSRTNSARSGRSTRDRTSQEGSANLAPFDYYVNLGDGKPTVAEVVAVKENGSKVETHQMDAIHVQRSVDIV